MRISENKKFNSGISGLFLAFFVLVPVSGFAQTQPGIQPAGPLQDAPGWNTEIVNGRRAAAREVLFRFRDSFLARAAPGLITSTIAELRRAEDAEDFEMLTDSGVLRIRSRSKSVDNLIRQLSQRGDILYAEPNYIVRMSDAPPVNDFRFGELWGLHNTGQGIIPGIPGADIDAVRAWTMSTGSASNVVAVVDTGVDYGHPDLAANMWRAPAAFSVTVAGRTITCAAGTHGYNAITDTCDPMDDQNHGTHVAGTIGAVGNNSTGVVGVSRTARIMALKFLDSNGYGSIGDAIKAIDFAIQVKARFAATKGANIRVLNNSWGGDGFSEAMRDAIRRAHQADMLFVASAGNDWRDIDFWPTYPASYNEPNVITVAATNNQDQRAMFSNYGVKSVHIAAPGDTILSTVRNGEYAYLSGTSMAAPHVSGAAALMLANCSVDTARLKDVLIRSGDVLGSLGGATVTGARLNVWNALNSCTMPYYTMSVAPAELTVLPGQAGSYTVTITPFRAYNGAVTMSAAGLPPGVTATFQPSVVSVNGVPKTTVLRVSVPVNVLPGVHTFTIRGVSATQDREVTAFLRVPGYTITDLGSLPAPDGQREVEARAINSTGKVAGYSNGQPPGWFSAFTRAFVHDGTTMRDLGTLGGPLASAWSIGDAGHVAGYSLNEAGYAHAFLWNNNRMTDLGTLPGHAESYAYGVNRSGHVVGFSGVMYIDERAFLRTTGAMRNLGTLGGNRSRALAINNRGEVVGYSETEMYSYTDHAFVYRNGTMRDLGTIGGNPMGASQAVAINDNGQIAGSSTVGGDFLTVHACVWENNTVRDLGGLPGFNYSYARGINSAGHVVGFISPVEESIAGDARQAFLHRDGRMLNLNTAVPLNTPWTLLQANSINDSGVIVGVGKWNNELRAFKLTPLR